MGKIKLNDDMIQIKNKLNDIISSENCLKSHTYQVYKNENEEYKLLSSLIYLEILDLVSQGEARILRRGNEGCTIYILDVENGYSYEYHYNHRHSIKKISKSTTASIYNITRSYLYYLDDEIHKLFMKFALLNEDIGNSIQKRRCNSDVVKEDSFPIELKKFIKSKIRHRKLDLLLNNGK